VFEKIKSISIELTDRCNLLCKHCSTEASPDKNTFISYDSFERLLYSGKELGADCLSLSGGEPLLHPEIEKMVKKASDLNYNINIYTSGVMKNNNVISEKRLLFLKKNVDTLIFSVFSDENNLHDYITGIKGSFNTTINSIEATLEHNINTEIHTVPMSVNYKKIPQIIELANNLGINQVSLLRLVPQGRCTENKNLIMDNLEVEELKSMVKRLENNKKDIIIRKGAPYKCLFIEEADNCSAAEDKILISPNGDVHPCEAFKSDQAVSNINQHDLYYIWQNDKRLNQLRELNKYQISNCNNCSQLEDCKGGCPGQRWLKHKDVLIGPDPGCIEYEIK
jgi:radical SAM protein with 4Fe4S-binding SPASM domain